MLTLEIECIICVRGVAAMFNFVLKFIGYYFAFVFFGALAFVLLCMVVPLLQYLATGSV